MFMNWDWAWKEILTSIHKSFLTDWKGEESTLKSLFLDLHVQNLRMSVIPTYRGGTQQEISGIDTSTKPNLQEDSKTHFRGKKFLLNIANYAWFLVCSFSVSSFSAL